VRSLLYHRVVQVPEPDDRYSVSLTRFDRQMQALVRRDWRGGSVGEAADRPEDDPVERGFALTFDDGYEDFERLALPVLERCGFTATVFVVTGHVGGRAQWDGGMGAPLLGWRSIRELHERGIEFGSHTRTHPHLTRLSSARARDEIRGSREDLEDRIGSAVRWLAYPYGESDSDVRRLARESGYEDAFGVLPSRPGPFQRPRIECDDGDGPFGMTLKVSRWYPVFARVISKSHRQPG